MAVTTTAAAAPAAAAVTGSFGAYRALHIDAVGLDAQFAPVIADIAAARPAIHDALRCVEEETCGRKSGAVRKPCHNLEHALRVGGPEVYVATWIEEDLALIRGILRTVSCAYAVDTGATDAGVLPLWVARSDRFGAPTATPTIVLSGAHDAGQQAVDECTVDKASPRDLTYVLTVEGESARFLACAEEAFARWTNADAAHIESQLADDPEPDPDAVATVIAERLGGAGIPVGHLFDGVDQWG